MKSPSVATAVVKNNIPYELMGIKFNKLFGMAAAFVKDQKGTLFFQIIPSIRIVDLKNNEIKAEFKTVSSYICDKTIEQGGFFELNYDSMLSAISEFDRELKKIKSTLTVNEFYLPHPSFEEAKLVIKKAYMLINLGRPSNN